jgi:hypothetical protein
MAEMLYTVCTIGNKTMIPTTKEEPQHLACTFKGLISKNQASILKKTPIFNEINIFSLISVENITSI